MVSANLIIVEIILFTVLTNGQPNKPTFLCHHRDDRRMERYEVTLDRGDYATIANCTDSAIIDEIIDHLYEYGTTTEWMVIQHDSSILNNVTRLRNATDLDLSGNNLTEIDLRSYTELQELNLTSNRIRSLKSIKLSDITLNSLDMSRNRLLKFEHLLLPSTRKLILRSNNIFELPSNISLPESLLELDLTRNEIENVTDVIIRSKTLKVLNLSINLINAFTYSVIEQLPKLEVLVLECNKILELAPGTFSKNSKLTELNLRDNNLSTIKKGVFENLVNLQVLDISKNNLLQLTPEILQNLNNLMDFSVSENHKLCQYACKRNLEFLLVLGGRLRTLKMNHLRLRKFPITLTTSIRHLDLSENKLTAVQVGNLENFPHLETLTLSSNEIESVETQVFSSMEHLVILRLDKNCLKRVPPSLPSSLIELRLNHNRISRLQKTSFVGLSNLQVLHLEWNSIETIESGSMAPLHNLRTLDISNNPILKLSTDSWEGLNSLRTLMASDLREIHMNVTDVRYFPTSELRNLRSLNLTRSPQLVRWFLSDLPLLATVKQLETVDFSYTNLSAVPGQIQNYLPRLKLLRLRGNTLNCSASWFGSRDYDYREFSVNRTTNRLKIRLGKSTSGHRDDRDCAYTNFNRYAVSSEQFWSNVAQASKPPSTRFFPSDTPILTSVTHYIGNESLTTPAPTSTLRARNVQSTRKKLNARSLHTSQFSQRNAANQTNAATAQIKLPSDVARIQTSTVVFDASTPRTQFQATPYVTSRTNEPLPTPVQLNDSAIRTTIRQNYKPPTSTRKTLLTSPPTSQLQKSTLISLRPVTAALQVDRVYRNHSHHVSATPNATKDHYESLVWNQTNDTPSFFDWFPGAVQNDSYSDDLAAERSIKPQQDSEIQYTHPGLVIFSAVTCFLLVIFVSLVVPPYVQKYRWRRQRYKMSQFDNECQRSIEISSISAFVETEIPLE